MGFNSWKDNGATLGRSGFEKADSESSARIAGVERSRVREMRGVWLGGWSGLASVRSTGRGGRNELSIRERRRVDLVSRNTPCG